MNIDIDKLEELPFSEKRFRNRWGNEYRFRSHFIGFLKSRVGQNIDDVFSEFVHAKWVPHKFRNYKYFCSEVEVNTYFHKEKIAYYPHYSNYNQKEISYVDDCGYYKYFFYVNPKDKTLQVKYRKYQIKKIEPLTMIPISEGHQYLKLKGIWYEVKGFDLYGKLGKYQPLIIEGQDFFRCWGSSYVGVLISLKRQLNSKELKKLGIKNG